MNTQINPPPSPPKKPYHRSRSGWSEERRARHRAAIRTWAPWQKSTGPRTDGGKRVSAHNATKHGKFSAETRAVRTWLCESARFLKLLNMVISRQKAIRKYLANQKNTALNKTFISRNELLKVQIETHADFFQNYEPQRRFDEILRQKSQQKSRKKLNPTRLEMAKMAA